MSRAFKLTEPQYLAKCSRVAAQLTEWDQAWFVREFLAEPVRPRRGLPSRPRADTAVTLRLNTSPTWKYIDPEDVNKYWEYR